MHITLEEFIASAATGDPQSMRFDGGVTLSCERLCGEVLISMTRESRPYEAAEILRSLMRKAALESDARLRYAVTRSGDLTVLSRRVSEAALSDGSAKALCLAMLSALDAQGDGA